MSRSVALHDGAVTVVDIPNQPLTTGQVRVKVTRAGVNFWEVMQRRGRVPQAPAGVLGTEGVGLVVETAPDVTALTAGARVAWAKVPGSYSDEVVSGQAQFFPVPEGVDDATAAGLLFQGMTAHYLATDAWALEAGQVAVVTAAAGGVGLLLTQLLAQRGVAVIGVVSTPAKHRAVLDAGAVDVVDYGSDLVDRVLKKAPDGVAAVYDSVGGGVAERLVGALRTRGAMVLYGASSGREASITTSELGGGSYFLTRTGGKHYTRDSDEASGRARALFALAAEGRLRVHEGATWALDHAPAALDALESRGTVGKLYIVP